jgi:hypothetical protein
MRTPGTPFKIQLRPYPLTLTKEFNANASPAANTGAAHAVLQAASHSGQYTLGRYATRTGRIDTVPVRPTLFSDSFSTESQMAFRCLHLS